MYNRYCPKCGNEIIYTNKYNRNNAEKENRFCKSCSAKENYVNFWTEELKEKRSRKYVGKGNPFYGKKHTTESIEKYKEKRKTWDWKLKTDEYKKLQSELNSGKNNFFYGKSLYDVFVEKYGKNEADKRWENRKKILSEKTSGKNNPMYGKPSPQGSGNGWSGWYKGWFFRSLRELSYMIKVIERFDLKWNKMDEKQFAIKYIDWEEKTRNYFPDFLIENKYVVEIKPKKLWNTPNILAKKRAAERWCDKNGYTYKIVEPKIIEKSEIIDLYINGQIKFLEKYEKKFKEKFLNE